MDQKTKKENYASLKDGKKFLPKLFKILSKYLAVLHDEGQPVVHYQKATSLKKILGLEIKKRPSRDQEIFRDLEKFLFFSVKTGHKNFLNQLYGAITWPSFFGEVLASLTNTSMATYEISPVWTLVEQALIKKMNSMIGYKNGEGIFLTGGSNANMVALLCARNHLFPQVKNKGLYLKNKLLLFVSEEAHYSFQKAANCLGLGVEQIVKVKCNSQGEMCPKNLRQLILQGKAQGGVPFFVGATAGTTVSGAFDPLRPLAEICRKYRLWLHVDAAYGAGLLFSPKNSRRLLGRDECDSFTWDAHKTMGVPLICSALLLREKGVLQRNIGGGGMEYLFHAYENEEYDLGKLSLQCGRRNDVLKLWLSWKLLGDDGLKRRMEKLLALAKGAEELVRRHPCLSLTIPRQSFNVCFQFIPPSENKKSVEAKALNHLQLLIREKIVHEGRYLVNYASKNGKVFLRAVFLNPDWSKKDVKSFLMHIVETGNAIWANP